jgi:arylsulfatase A-like enzyme
MSAPRRPNILWVCTEHQRYDTVHALGNPHIRTPNLDRLVREGVALTHAYAQNSVCTPSRASFLTGRYPITTGCRQNGQDIRETEVPITRTLRDLGYDCGLAGKLHLSAAYNGWERRIDDGYRFYQWSHGSTAKHGGDWVAWLASQGKTFDDVYRPSSRILCREVTDRKYHQTTWCFDQALAFLQEKREGPWLVSINPFSAHDPYDYLPEFIEHYESADLPAPLWQEGELDGKPEQQLACYQANGYAQTTDEQRRAMKAAYYAAIEHIDAELGRLLDWLKETGQRENTLIIFNSDHGDLQGDHGIFRKGPYLYEGAVRVPLILSWPGVLPQDRQYSALVEQVDIVPTIHELLGLPIPPGVQGKSLLPLLSGQCLPHQFRSGVYCEYYNSNPAGTSPLRRPSYATMWRTRTHKIVVYHGQELGELYDLSQDPNEFVNLWDNPGHAAVKQDLLKQCFDASVFTMDPLPERSAGF